MPDMHEFPDIRGVIAERELLPLVLLVVVILLSLLVLMVSMRLLLLLLVMRGMWRVIVLC